ncbi:MAG: uncharacterized protein JWO94_1342 [Verrucomicrobiaceae bacterium]|nr:uncharacterized protein [Verrucomicrobiaceae bacterium]
MALRAPSSIPWPDGKDFAFTVFDDTERATVENNRAIYGFLRDLGMRTTKTVWPVAGPGVADIPGPTCEDEDYLELCLQLQREGFEMALHNATYHTADRTLTRQGFDRFRELFGHDPHTLANHSTNREGLYWGPARLSSWRRQLYKVLQRGERFKGHVEGDPLFWGDICKERVRYVRNFTYTDLNTLNSVPQMPYHDPQRPWVNQWFAASDAAEIGAFNRYVTRQTVDKLIAERGCGLVYTHFGKYFHVDGRLDPAFVDTMEHVASHNGWFVPVSTLLDFLASLQPAPHVITDAERNTLENRWLCDQLAHVLHRFRE